ncbi:MAG: hypothetical protein RMK18_02835 [Armatimonadota bacterium]|nr:hypothetical protein [Armatimonadota bacterium]MCX7776957.1 hypothetical protein [Armatimonadota bacterium]MDW8024791.1 hypothetical protein [Armatimonadota bacterium]
MFFATCCYNCIVHTTQLWTQRLQTVLYSNVSSFAIPVYRKMSVSAKHLKCHFV